MYKAEYITNDFAVKTKYQTLKDAIDRDYFSVVKYRNGVWLECRNCPESIYERAIRELKRIYDDYYIFLN